jgi:hypothetical protein
LKWKEKKVESSSLKVERKRSTINIQLHSPSTAITSIGPKIGGWDLRWLGLLQSSHGFCVFKLLDIVFDWLLANLGGTHMAHVPTTLLWWGFHGE